MANKDFKLYALAGWTINGSELSLPMGGYLKYFDKAPQKAVSGRIIGKDINYNFSGNYLTEGILNLEMADLFGEYIYEKMKIDGNKYHGRKLEFYLFELENIPSNLLPL